MLFVPKSKPNIVFMIYNIFKSQIYKNIFIPAAFPLRIYRKFIYLR